MYSEYHDCRSTALTMAPLREPCSARDGKEGNKCGLNVVLLHIMHGVFDDDSQQRTLKRYAINSDQHPPRRDHALARRVPTFYIGPSGELESFLLDTTEQKKKKPSFGKIFGTHLREIHEAKSLVFAKITNV